LEDRARQVWSNLHLRPFTPVGVADASVGPAAG
jgi:hypothetical protein